MKFRLNGKQVTREQAFDAAREAVPNGGVAFLEQVIRNNRIAKGDSIRITVGGSPLVIELVG